VCFEYFHRPWIYLNTKILEFPCGSDPPFDPQHINHLILKTGHCFTNARNTNFRASAEPLDTPCFYVIVCYTCKVKHISNNINLEERKENYEHEIVPHHWERRVRRFPDFHGMVLRRAAGLPDVLERAWCDHQLVALRSHIHRPHLFLSIGSYRKVASRSTMQALVIYVNWVVLLVPMVTIAFLKCVWTGQDSLIFSLIVASAIAVVMWGKFNGRGLADPIIRGMLVGLFRVVPHLFMAYCIFSVGSGHGIAAKTVFAANITALARITTLYLSGRNSQWKEKGVRAILLAESANEASWMVTTIVWYIYR